MYCKCGCILYQYGFEGAILRRIKAGRRKVYTDQQSNGKTDNQKQENDLHWIFTVKRGIEGLDSLEDGIEEKHRIRANGAYGPDGRCSS